MDVHRWVGELVFNFSMFLRDYATLFFQNDTAPGVLFGSLKLP